MHRPADDRLRLVAGGQGKVTVTSSVGSTSSQQCHEYKAGDPAPIPSACVDSSATLNQPTCRKYSRYKSTLIFLTRLPQAATAGPQPSGYRKRSVPRGCTVAGHTRCEVRTGRGGWECIDINTTLECVYVFPLLEIRLTFDSFQRLWVL